MYALKSFVDETCQHHRMQRFEPWWEPFEARFFEVGDEISRAAEAMPAPRWREHRAIRERLGLARGSVAVCFTLATVALLALGLSVSYGASRKRPAESAASAKQPDAVRLTEYPGSRCTYRPRWPPR